ncbi:probable inactive receptor kinase At2g26730 [Ricinus communis]|uniref:probable inactive receptor kinase At2g26730 n=1 Tax=Ricinus communis TaxID=3988 RepID=UPI000D690E64|nr:probable inactive receptor kinase At2g26730 [Ricinus communis]|eukprot:XP_015573618.2 LOW QUALITY PROTEIN: probable inactive receptor kinase At2g26730 [Ricinus communis]
MKQTPICVIFISLALLFHSTNSAVEEGVKASLIKFLAKLNGTNAQPDPSFGWNNATDPCQGGWKGVICDTQTNSSVRRIYLNQSSLSGVFDAASLCNVPPLASSLVHIKLDQNNIGGQLPAEIVNCKNLNRLLIRHNQFSGNLPDSLAMLNNLKRLDISYNSFSGSMPNMSRISGLSTFLAQYNKLTGEIPNFDLTNFEMFNVSFNDFTGAIPVKTGRFDQSSFMGNPGLCGPLLNRVCSLSSDDNIASHKDGVSKDDILMYSGYGLVGFVFLGLIIYKVGKRNKKNEKGDSINQVSSVDDGMEKPGEVSADYKIAASRSAENSATVSTSLIVLTSPVVNGFSFEDLLRAPAELIERGKHGSLYRVICENGLILAVKRIKGWAISSNEFKQRMQKIYQVTHPNVLSPLAFYCSKQEKLLVYEYQQYGSLHKFLHGTQTGQAFEWISRLNVAARIAEALAFMHQELRGDGIAHGNLKSSNVLFNKNMEPCISEYGLMVVDNNQDSSSSSSFSSPNAFKEDVYGFGVILLELLTGKLVQTNGIDLTTWVHSVVREEWTVEVFDKILISEGASEERMVNLLQVAIKCVHRSPENRPAMNQVAVMINTIKEEEDKSVTFEG